MKKIVLAFTMFLATAGMAFAQADLQPIVTVKLGKSEIGRASCRERV